MLVKRKPNFVKGLIIIKVNIELFEKLIGNFLRNYSLDGHSGIEDWDFVILAQCETHAQLKERETF